MAHTAATAVVTPRWPKRNAAQTMNGTMRKVRAPLPWNTICVAPSSSTPNTAASASRRGCQRSLPAPAQDQRREDQHAAGVALPPGRPVAEQLARRHAVEQRRAASSASVGAMVLPSAASSDEAHHLVDALEAVRHADVPPHQRGHGDRLQRAAGGDDRARRATAPSIVRLASEAADADRRPEPRAAEQQRGQRDARRRPDGGGVARRNRHQQRELRRAEIARRRAAPAGRRRLSGLQTLARGPPSGLPPPPGRPRGAPGRR